MIALGLSLLFGIGWAIGLLASSGVPDAVRRPAEWIFTLMTAFLGVYLFVLYILRSSDARGLWNQWLLCQCRKKRSVGLSNASSSKASAGMLSSTVTSWWQSLKSSILGEPLKNTSASGSTEKCSSHPYSSSVANEKLTGVASSHAEPSFKLDSSSANDTSSPVEIELVCEVNADEESSIEENDLNVFSLSEVPEKLDAEKESLVETMSFHDQPSMKRMNSISSMNGTRMSGAHEESYTEQMQSEELTETNSL